MAKVRLSKSEWQTLDDYINYSIANPNPCEGCQDSGTCCGCLKEQIYCNKIEEIGAGDLMEIKDVRLYVELSIKYAKAQKELAKAQEMVKKVSTELAAVKARFIEDTVTADDIRAKFKCPLCECKYEAAISICVPFITSSGVGFKCPCPKCNAVRVTTDCYKKEKS